MPVRPKYTYDVFSMCVGYSFTNHSFVIVHYTVKVCELLQSIQNHGNVVVSLLHELLIFFYFEKNTKYIYCEKITQLIF